MLTKSEMISIHAPARGATTGSTPTKIGVFNFYPRSREGSDRGAGFRWRGRKVISIHAPARGATAKEAPDDMSRDISIHAPARGATRKKRQRQTEEKISIHAPARGATCWRLSFAQPKQFLSTLPRGERRAPFRP